MFDKLHKIEQGIFDLLAVFLVLFYSYSAVLAPAATQFHRGIYVIITYVLVFLLYPAPKHGMRALLSIGTAAVASGLSRSTKG